MSTGTLIDGTGTLASRRTQPGLSTPDALTTDRDARRAAWQHELERARANPSETPITAGTPQRLDALAAFAATFDPLLLRSSAGHAGSAPGDEARADTQASSSDRHGPRATHADATGRPADAHDGTKRSAAAPPTAGGVAIDPRLTAPNPDIAKHPSTTGGSAAVARVGIAAAAHDTGAAFVATREPSIVTRPASPRTWPFMAGASTAGASSDVLSHSPDFADGAATTSARLQAALTDATQLHAPIRLHVEWSASGARIWLGLDAANADDTTRIVEIVAGCLKCLGARVRSVVCNGVKVPFADGAPSAAVPSGHASPFPVDLLIERIS